MDEIDDDVLFFFGFRFLMGENRWWKKHFTHLLGLACLLGFNEFITTCYDRNVK